MHRLSILGVLSTLLKHNGYSGSTWHIPLCWYGERSAMHSTRKFIVRLINLCEEEEFLFPPTTAVAALNQTFVSLLCTAKVVH